MVPNEFRFIVYARDFERSVEFYGHVLGLAPLHDWDRDDGRGAAYSVGGTAVVEIIGTAGSGIDEGQRASGVSMGIEVADVDDWYARLRSHGVECTEPSDEWWGGRSLFLFDPNDLPIVIYQSSR